MANKNYLLFIILILGICFYTCVQETDITEEDNKDTPFNIGDAKVAAYIRTWSIPAAEQEQGSAHWNAGMIQGEYLSDLIIAFALINGTDGFSLEVPDTAWTFRNMWDEINAVKAKYPHLKVTISVGGANESGFTGMASDIHKRTDFIINVCNWMETYNLDGVDIDWEYPVRPLKLPPGAAWGTQFPEDRENYITLLRELRDVLDDLGDRTGTYYSLSTAVPASSWFVSPNQGLDIKTVAEITDSLKLMAYDYYGSWSSTTGHNANLYPGSRGDWSTDDAVKAYLNAGVAPEKIMVGIAFYGHHWDGVQPGNNINSPGLFSPRPFTGTGTYSWSEIKRYFLDTGSGYTRYWDNFARAPFLYNGDRWISYTDHEQIREITRYVKDKNLGGVFTWEYGHDMKADLLQTMAESMGGAISNSK